MNKFYITTSIAYVNAPPHIGYALESIQADAIARYQRMKGKEVFFLTGTDEHGTKVARSAEKAGVSPQELTNANAEKFKALKDALNLSWDDFIRTTDKKRHWPNVEMIWKKLAENGDIYKKTYKGLYCVGHEAFVTEKDLVGGKCADHQKEPEIIEEENYFFKLSKYADDVAKKIESGELEVIPETRKNEILSFIKQGVTDISFSRPSKTLSWGIPVPGDESQTIYVWADALVNYLFPKEFWPADVHVIGKDILRFHALYWPAMLISAGMELPKKIFTHGFIVSGGQKMSKSLGNVIDPLELSRKYGADAVRYFLLREIPAYYDGDFTVQKFEERYNGDLANGLGNFAARVLTLGSQIGEIKANGKFDEMLRFEILKKISETREQVDKNMQEFKFNEALTNIWGLIAFGDKFINEEKPWSIESMDKKQEVLVNLIVILDHVAALIVPFLPDASQKITKNIIWKNEKTLAIKKGEVLFPRLSA